MPPTILQPLTAAVTMSQLHEFKAAAVLLFLKWLVKLQRRHRRSITFNTMRGKSMETSGSSSPEVCMDLEPPTFAPSEPPQPPTIRYYYSTTVARNVSYIYRVVETENHKLECYPEAQGWPRLTFTNHKELEKNFKLLLEREIANSTLAPEHGATGEQVRFPSLEEVRHEWQVGCEVRFRHCDVRMTGKVTGRFVWHCTSSGGGSGCGSRKQLRLVLLLQLPTNELILSSEVTDLVASAESINKEEVYIQGISLISVVATLIANVAYLASVSPIRGIDESRQGVAVASYFPIPKLFLFFNAFAFYAAVLAVVLMTAFIPIYGTAGRWGAIFMSGSVPVVLSLVAFYVAYMVSAWATLDSWGMSLGITLVGILMVVYARFWAIQLMHGNVDRNLEMAPKSNPWDWYHSRLQKNKESRSQVGVVEIDDIGIEHSFSLVERLLRGTAMVHAKVQEFLMSPTIWQLSVLGSMSERKKARTKSKILLEHLPKTKDEN